MKKKTAQDVLVSVSALAVLTAPVIPAWAQLTDVRIVCKQDIDIGKLIASGCSGKYVIEPNGAHHDSGCLLILSTAQAGVCTVTTKKGPPSKSAFVSFTKGSFTINTNKGNVATMKSLKMQIRGGTTAGASKLTLTPTALKNTVTLDIGGTLYYSDFQAAGKYSGKVAVKVDF